MAVTEPKPKALMTRNTARSRDDAKKYGSLLHWAGRLSFLLSGLTAAVVLYYGVIFTGSLPDHRLISGWNDTLLHFGAFGLLSVLVLPLAIRAIAPILVLAAFAGGIEAAQALSTDRTASMSDFAAGIAGIAMGWICVSAVQIFASRFF